MTFDSRIVTTLVMFVLFAGGTLLALGLPAKAAFMPLLVGIPGTILCAIQIVLDLRADKSERAARAEAREAERTEDAASEAEMMLWLGAFTAIIVGFGFIIGGSLMVTAFVRFSSRDSWPNALFAGAGTLMLLYGVFIWLLELPLFSGLIFEALM